MKLNDKVLTALAFPCGQFGPGNKVSLNYILILNCAGINFTKILIGSLTELIYLRKWFLTFLGKNL